MQAAKTLIASAVARRASEIHLEPEGDDFAARLQIDGLSVSGSARQSILIDGPVASGSSVAHVTLAGGDEKKGIVEQNFSGGTAPAVGAGAPQVTQSAGMVDAIPLGPATPASP